MRDHGSLPRTLLCTRSLIKYNWPGKMNGTSSEWTSIISELLFAQFKITHVKKRLGNSLLTSKELRAMKFTSQQLPSELHYWSKFSGGC
jgi:hypothetical protein